MEVAAQCTDLARLAAYLGFAPQNLYYLVQLRDELYTEIKIPKRNNPRRSRQISIPSTELKGVQRAILKLILKHESVNQNAYAYVEGRSVVQAAKQLCGTKSVLKVDLRNFFPSISEDRIFGLFRKFEFNEQVSYVLTRLCTYQGALCQGAPTSPYLSNLVCRRMDRNLASLSARWGINYLRYSDDLFFYSPTDYRYRTFLPYIRRVVRDNGFVVNGTKTKYSPIGRPRFCLGLATHNSQIALPKKTRKAYRAAFFKASRNLKWARENAEKLAGMAEWYRSVYGQDDTYLEYKKVIRNIRELKMHEHYTVG